MTNDAVANDAMWLFLGHCVIVSFIQVIGHFVVVFSLIYDTFPYTKPVWPHIHGNLSHNRPMMI